MNTANLNSLHMNYKMFICELNEGAEYVWTVGFSF